MNHYSSTILKVDFLGFEPSCWPASPPRGPSADGTTHVTNAWDMTKNTPAKIIDLPVWLLKMKISKPIPLFSRFPQNCM